MIMSTTRTKSGGVTNHPKDLKRRANAAQPQDPEEELVGCPCTGATLDKLIQPAILAVLADGPIHGYALADRLAAMPAFSGDRPDVSGIYRFLKAMERRELVSSSWDMSESGPAKKTYELTPAGRQCLHRWVRTLELHRKSISSLLNVARQAAKQ
jgi:PadR family transcriptional regulator, regulatory protein PadR